MITPRPELATVLTEIKDLLTEAEIIHFTTHPEDDPDVCVVGAHDEEGYVNRGIVGWAPGTSEVLFFCYEPARANRDRLEGIEEDESKCWWTARDLPMFMLFLTGEVRRIVRKAEKMMIEEEEEKGEDLS